MNHDDRKRQKKRRREKKKELASSLRRLKRLHFPALIVESEDGAHPALREAVEAAIARFRYDDDAMCPPQVRGFYKVIRQVGWNEVIDQWIETHGNGGEKAAKMTYAVQFMSQHLGNWIFDQVPEDIKRDATPFSIFQIHLGQETTSVRLTALRKAKGVGGNIYYSETNKGRPLPIGDGEYPLAFSRHAIDQICFRERNPKLSYSAALHVHRVLSDWTCVEVRQLCDATPAVALFAVCDLPSSRNHDLYVKRLLGVACADWTQELFAYRLGYCPIVVDNGFAKALTFLYPGYRNTPERRLIERSRDLAHSKRVKWLEVIENLSVENLGDEQHAAAIEWFHRNAAVQVYRQGDVGKSPAVREYPASTSELA